MSTAASISFIIVMALGMIGLTTLVYRDRRTTAPPSADPLDGEHWPPPRDLYEATVREHGDPDDIDFTSPAPVWPR